MRWLPLLLCLGCTATPVSEPKPADFDTAAVVANCLKLYDANQNGSLEAGELSACPGLQDAFAKIDADRSRSISAAELTTRFDAYKATLSGIVPVAIYVKLDNSPLAGARVTLEPEPFLAEYLKTVSGDTDDTGRCGVFVLGEQPQNGAAAGLYKIKITKDGQDIPTRYNTATTLGREIVTDGRAGEVEITLSISLR